MDSNNLEDKKKRSPRIGITIGDINGIGPEIILKGLRDPRILNQLTPVIYGSSKTLSYYRKTFNMHDFNFTTRKVGEEIADNKVNVINCWEEAVSISVGKVTPEAGQCARLALVEAIKGIKEQVIDGVVTAPINKSNIYSDDFQFKGHTGFFASHFNDGESLMMMVSDVLRVGLVTDHVPLREVVDALSKEKIASKTKVFEQALKNDFGISKPRIALLGLNPHAGEDGLLGTEELELIAPVVQQFQEEGKLVYGPYPADGFFGSSEWKKFDGVMGMYHDQALIPFKSLSFQSGVNYTAGISAIRASPDHGTANSIAGRNIASEQSFRKALFLVRDIIKNRS